MEVIYVLGGILLVAAVVFGRAIMTVIRMSHDEAVEKPSLALIQPVVDVEVKDDPASAAIIQSLNGEIAQLKEEIARINDLSGVQVQEAENTINLLKEENARLKNDMTSIKAEDNRQQIDDQISHLKAENYAFKQQIDQVQGNIHGEYQQQLEVFRQEIEILKQENQSMKASQASQVQQSSAHSFLNTEAVEALKEDLDVLHQDKNMLERRIEELEAVARDEEEANKFLQYELIKSRAQAIGVERIAENVRRQYEGKFNK